MKAGLAQNARQADGNYGRRFRRANTGFNEILKKDPNAILSEKGQDYLGCSL
jgi:hypothetical protein